MLPIIPSAFKLIVRTVKTKDGYKSDPAALRQLEVLRRLFARCERIVVATDAGREGELIFRYLYDYLECNKPFDRLWISSLTDKAIRQGFDSLRPGREFDNLYHSARARREADWLVGINASQALMLSAGRGGYSLGRVQTPTLAMICRRFRENRDFISDTFHQLQLIVEKKGVRFTSLNPGVYKDRAEAEAKLSEARKADRAIVLDVLCKEIAQEAPLLYDLTALQRDANVRLGFSADKTLSLAQSLYEKQLISYPRTGCRYIGIDLFEQIPSLLALLETHPALGACALALKDSTLNTHSVDDTKLTDHHALIITENVPEALPEDETEVSQVAQFEFIPWILTQCATVAEAREKLAAMRLTGTAFSEQLPTAQLHWIIADKDSCIVVESMKDGLHVYDNPVGVLTNNPPFPSQMFALNNYAGVSRKQPESTFAGVLQLDAYSRGMGGMGIPGDLSSQSRFVKVAFTKLNSISGEEEDESVSQFFHILGSVDQQRGCCEVTEGKYEITIYTSCCNTAKGIYYYTTYDNHQITAVDMHAENLDSEQLICYPLLSKGEVRWQNK